MVEEDLTLFHNPNTTRSGLDILESLFMHLVQLILSDFALVQVLETDDSMLEKVDRFLICIGFQWSKTLENESVSSAKLYELLHDDSF